MRKVEDYVGSVSDFPEPGITSRDVTTILQDADELHLVVDEILDMLKDVDFDVVVGPESKDFIFGVSVTHAVHRSLVPVRKREKLPCEAMSMEYNLGYRSAVVETHKDAIKSGQKVVVVDDLIATGNTIEAIIKLIEGLGGEVMKIRFVTELAGLKGREKLSGYDMDSIITYEGN